MCYMHSKSEEKAGYEITDNHNINKKLLQKKKEKFLVFCSCAQEDILQIRREEGKHKKNLISYVKGHCSCCHFRHQAYL